MPQYDVYMFCPACFNPHKMGISLPLDDRKYPPPAAIGDKYQGIEVPAEVATVARNSIRCLTSGEIVTQESNERVFLEY